MRRKNVKKYQVGVPYNLTMGYNVSNIHKKEGKTGSNCIRSTVVFSVF